MQKPGRNDEIRTVDLESLVTVAEQGSFSKAAQLLGIPASTVSRRVTRLESALGVQLVRRGPHSIIISPEGRKLQATAAPALRALAVAIRDMDESDSSPAGTLTLTAPTELAGAPFFVQMLAAFSLAYPQLRIDLVVSQQRLNLLDQDVDVAVRLYEMDLPSSDQLMVRKLARVTAALFASPLYLERHGPVRGLEDLPSHRLLSVRDWGARQAWPLWSEMDKFSMDVHPHWTASDFLHLYQAALAGAGIALLPMFLALPAVRSGNLVHVLPGLQTPPGQLSLVWLARSVTGSRLRAFIDFFTERLEDFWPVP